MPSSYGLGILTKSNNSSWLHPSLVGSRLGQCASKGNWEHRPTEGANMERPVSTGQEDTMGCHIQERAEF